VKDGIEVQRTIGLRTVTQIVRVACVPNCPAAGNVLITTLSYSCRSRPASADAERGGRPGGMFPGVSSSCCSRASADCSWFNDKLCIIIASR